MKKIPGFLLALLLTLSAAAAGKFPKKGLASYYGDRMNHHRVASGERYSKDSFTAAHRTLPFGTYLKVTSLSNNKTVIVRINDRGPHRKHRIIDLSGAAANRLDMKRSGVTTVKIDFANAREIDSQRIILRDSLKKDTVSANAGNKTRDSLLLSERYLIQGGAYKKLSPALSMKQYLADNGMSKVRIRSRKTRRHHLYKVVIGPLDLAGKEKALEILKNKGITGLVMRL
jgi:rare lipoprotein A